MMKVHLKKKNKILTIRNSAPINVALHLTDKSTGTKKNNILKLMKVLMNKITHNSLIGVLMTFQAS